MPCFIGIQEYFIDYRFLTEGKNDLSSGWVGQILHRQKDDNHIILKGSVRYSKSIHCRHYLELIFRMEYGLVVEVSCDCMANRGRCCSHTAALLYKVEEAVT